MAQENSRDDELSVRSAVAGAMAIVRANLERALLLAAFCAVLSLLVYWPNIEFYVALMAWGPGDRAEPLEPGAIPHVYAMWLLIPLIIVVSGTSVVWSRISSLGSGAAIAGGPRALMRRTSWVVWRQFWMAGFIALIIVLIIALMFAVRSLELPDFLVTSLVISLVIAAFVAATTPLGLSITWESHDVRLPLISAWIKLRGRARIFVICFLAVIGAGQFTVDSAIGLAARGLATLTGLELLVGVLALFLTTLSSIFIWFLWLSCCTIFARKILASGTLDEAFG